MYKKIFFLLLSALLVNTGAYAADIYLQVHKGKRLVMGMPPVVTKNDADTLKTSREIIDQTVASDILFSNILDLSQEGPDITQSEISFQAWSQTGSDLLLTLFLSREDKQGEFTSDTNIKIVSALYELPEGNPIFQKVYVSNANNALGIAHQISADILFRLTGIAPVSKSRVVFVNDQSGEKELYIIDYDGKNLKRLTYDKSLVLLPRASQDGQKILFTSYKNFNPDVYELNLKTGARRTISARKGLNAAAAYSPDEKQIALALSFEGNPNLYLLDGDGNMIRRLTNHRALDSSPSFSPDGKKMVFVSDRLKIPQIFMMDTDTSNMQRMSDGGYCDEPVFSPLGNIIAYSQGGSKGGHNIVIHDIVLEKRWTITHQQGNNESPSFSPDGQFVVFSSNRNGKRELFIASIDGTIQRRIAQIPGNSQMPAWIP